MTQMATKFVTARRKGVLGRIRVPERSLKYMPGWKVVNGPAEPLTKRQRERLAQIPANQAAEQTDPSAAEQHTEGA